MKREFRERIAGILNELEDGELRDLIELSLTAEKDAWVTCTECKHRIPVKLPDLGARAKLIEVLANQGLGKPREQAREEVPIGVTQVDDMSLAQLEAEEQAILAAHPELAESEEKPKKPRRASKKKR